MMPLCTIETRPATCGCAFASLGTPWVAQRVCAMPVPPGNGSARYNASISRTLPLARTRRIARRSSTARPEESKPRYSSAFRPTISSGATSRWATAATIPHMTELPWLEPGRGSARPRRACADGRLAANFRGSPATANDRSVHLAAQPVQQVDAGDQAEEIVAVDHDRHVAALEHRQQRLDRRAHVEPVQVGDHGGGHRVAEARLVGMHVQ